MKIISEKSQIGTGGSVHEIHVSFFVSVKDAFNLIAHNPQLKVLELPESYKKSISENTRKLLEANNVDVVFGNRTGTRTDLEAEMREQWAENANKRKRWESNKLKLRAPFA